MIIRKKKPSQFILVGSLIDRRSRAEERESMWRFKSSTETLINNISSVVNPHQSPGVLAYLKSAEGIKREAVILVRFTMSAIGMHPFQYLIIHQFL